jgi:hypothetical protein
MSDFQILDQFDELEEIENSTWSWQKLLKPQVTVAIGLHLLLLIIPIAGSQSHEATKPKKPEQQDEKVKLTTLSADTVLGSPAPTSPTPKASASDGIKPSPSSGPSPTANKTPEPKKLPSASIPKSSASNPKSSSPTPKPSASAPKPSSPTPKPSASTPTPSTSSPTPSPTNPKPSPSAPAPNAASSAIPAYPKGTRGAFGIPELAPVAAGAQQTIDDLAIVEQHHKGILPTKGFTINVSENSAIKKTFEVASKAGPTQFLTLFKVPQGTVIVTSNKPLPQNLADTSQQSVEEKLFDDTFAAGNGAAYASSPTGFKDNMFVLGNQFDADNPNMGSVQFIANQTEEQAFSGFNTAFSSKGFQVTKGNYGGSILVTVQKGTVAKYFSLVSSTPAKPDGPGVYVVGWKASP